MRSIVFRAFPTRALFLLPLLISTIHGDPLRICVDCDPGSGRDGGGGGGGTTRKCPPDLAEFMGCTPSLSDPPIVSDPDGRGNGYGSGYRPYGGPRFADTAAANASGPRAIPVPWGFAGQLDGVDASSGAFGKAMPIEVPGFRGLEPKLAITYHSEAGNGFVGMGWGLSGLSVLTGFPAVRGPLLWNGTDRFFLDGVELLNCANVANTSPFCSGGAPGTTKYFTKFETQQRIEYDPSDKSWTITQRNGTKGRYLLLPDDTATLPPENRFGYRWAIGRSTDIHNNVVNYLWEYSYVAGGGYGDFYPKEIQYNTNRIVFYREPRPDMVRRATSGSQLADTAERLKAIGVFVGSSVRSLYRLRYETSSTNRSRLKDLDVYGTDALVDTTGTVTNAAQPLSLASYTYTDSTPSYAAGVSSGSNLSGNFCANPATSSSDIISNMWDSVNYVLYTSIGTPMAKPALTFNDINKDGCSDGIVEEYDRVKISLSQCDGSFASPITTLLSSDHLPLSFGDFNGDGYPDFYFSKPYHGSIVAGVAVYIGNGAGSFTQVSAATPLPVRKQAPSLFSGTTGEWYWDAREWRRRDVTQTITTAAYIRARAAKLKVADLNGDQCDDIVSFNGCEYIGDANCGPTNVTFYRSLCSNPDGSFAGFNVGSTVSGESQGEQTNIQVFIHGSSKAVSATGAIQEFLGHTGYMLADLVRCSFADFDNNGRVDLMCIEPGTNTYGWSTMSLYLNQSTTGTDFRFVQSAGPSIFSNDYYGYYTARDGDVYPYAQMVRPIDWNGDGWTDVAVYPVATNWTAPVRIYVNLGNGTFGGPFDGPTQDFRLWRNRLNPTDGSIPGYDVLVPLFNRILTSDVDLDGKADFGRFDPTSMTFNVDLSSNRTLPGPSIRQPSCLFPADFNGDGQIDLAVAKDTGDFTGPLSVYMLSGTQGDLLYQTDNKIGGIETVTYDRRRDVNVGSKYAQRVVSNVTRTTGTQNLTEDHDYSGGKLDLSEVDGPRSLGFRSHTVLESPQTGQIQRRATITTFTQDPKGSRVEKVETSLENTSFLLSKTSTNYVTRTDGGLPYWVRTSQVDRERYDPSCVVIAGSQVCTSSSLAARSRVRFTQFDAYGNSTEGVDDGDPTVTGDETTTQNTFVSNTDTMVIGIPSTTRSYAGTPGALGDLLSETLYFTDEQTSHTAIPVKGNITRVDRRQCIDCTTAGGVSGFFSSLWSYIVSLFSGGTSPTPSQFVTSKAKYDSYGNRQWTEDELSHRSSYAYDTTFNLFPISTTNPALHVIQTEWDTVCGAVKKVRSPNNQDTTIEFDPYCREKKVTGPTGSYVRTVPCDQTPQGCGNVSVQYNATFRPKAVGTGEIVKKEYFDGLGRTYAEEWEGDIAGQLIRRDVRYDASGSVYRSSYPYLAGTPDSAKKWTDVKYDALGRIWETTRPDLSKVTASYSGLTVTSAEEIDAATSQKNERRETFDTRGRQLRIEHKVGGTFQTTQTYTYDPSGRVASVADASGAIERYGYDLLGKLKVSISPHNGDRTFGYDDEGRLLRVLDARGGTVNFQYDAIDRVTQKTIQDETGSTQTYTYVYDENRAGAFNKGFLTSSFGPSEKNFYNHDFAGRLGNETRTIDNIAYMFQWWYDRDGRVIAQKFPDKDFVGTPSTPWTYDVFGKHKTIPNYLTNTLYDSVDGSLKDLAYANGEAVRYTYDPNRRWVNKIEVTRNAVTTERTNYTSFDLAGKIKSVSLLDASTWTYGYDDLSNLLNATYVDTQNSARSFTQSFSYDLNGNLRCNSRFYASGASCGAASQNYAYDTVKTHAVRTISAQSGAPLPSMSFDYDANGNMSARNGTTLKWNSEQRLVSSGSTRLNYDAQNERLRKITPNGMYTLYLGHGAEIENQQFRKYISASGLPIAQKKVDTTEWLHTDHKGSVYRISSLTGQAVWKRQYRPYGEEIQIVSPDASSTPLRFRGSPLDPETGLTYFGARYYDGAVGRFISPDVLRTTHFPQGGNAYQYAANDPVNKVDTNGLFPQYGTVVDSTYNRRWDASGNLIYSGYELHIQSPWYESPAMGGPGYDAVATACNICGSFPTEVSASRTPLSASAELRQFNDANGGAGAVRISGGGESGSTFAIDGLVSAPKLRSGVVATVTDSFLNYTARGLNTPHSGNIQINNYGLSQQAWQRMMTNYYMTLRNDSLNQAMRAYAAADHTAVGRPNHGPNDFQIASRFIFGGDLAPTKSVIAFNASLWGNLNFVDAEAGFGKNGERVWSASIGNGAGPIGVSGGGSSSGAGGDISFDLGGNLAPGIVGEVGVSKRLSSEEPIEFTLGLGMGFEGKVGGAKLGELIIMHKTGFEFQNTPDTSLMWRYIHWQAQPYLTGHYRVPR